MKRFYILCCFLLAMTFAAKANPVSQQQARSIGAKFLTANTSVKLASEQDLKWVTTYRTTTGDAALHVFNAKEGWVVVAADDCATPILAYSTDGQFSESNLPPAMEEYLMSFVEQIEYGIQSGLPALDTVAHQWELVRASGLLRDDRATAAAVSPLLTSTWGQGDPGYQYNIFCPADANGPNGHTITGCTATAMAQIMRYWGYPLHGTGSHSYTPSGYNTQSVNFANATYDWANMPDALSPSSTQAQNNAVALLMWHCGVSIDAQYGPGGNLGGTNADESPVASALVDYFKYSSDAHFVWKSSYTDAEWLTKIKGNLNKGWPIHMRGANSSNKEGHMFVLDGYDSNDQIHINWGWDGYLDNYFALNAFTPGSMDFSFFNCGVFDIHPGECEDNSTRVLPYSDSFDADNTEWECWTKRDYSNSGNKTSWSTYAIGSSDMCASHYYNSSRNVNDWAIMPRMFLQPGRDYTQLSFYTYETVVENYKFEGVYISTTGTNQDDFTLLWSQSSPSASWKNVTINLNNYQGQAVYIAFVYKGKNGHNWFIDNVSVTEDWQPCSTVSLPFQENFTTSINGCWYIIDVDNSGGERCWQWKDASMNCAYHPKGQSGKPQEGWLISKRMFLQPGRDATTLTFYSASTGSGGSGRKNSVWLAIDKPEGELTPDDFTVKVWQDSQYNAGWTVYTVDLSAYQGKNINIGFKYEGTNTHDWYVTNVAVTESWNPCSDATANYSVDFNSSLSSCWYVIDNDMSGGLKCWQYDADNQCVKHPYGQQNMPQEGWLFSKRVQLPANYSYNLSFKSKSTSSGTGRRNSVWIAVDKTGTPNPSDYTEIWVAPSYSSSWTTYNIDLSAYAGHCVTVAFKYEGTFAHNWYVDDFNISKICEITATATPSAGGTVTGGGNYIHGSSCTLTATPNTGYHFVKWTKGSTQVSTNATYTFTVTANGTYKAHFALNSYDITATANPTAGGTVTGGGSYDHGSTVTLTAAPNIGYMFTGWKEGSTVVSTDATYSFTVTGDRTLVADFTQVSNGCGIVFDLADSYGDGWNGNKLMVTHDGISEQLTISDGSAASYTRYYPAGTQLTLGWISANYAYECSFTVSYEGGDEIYASSGTPSSSLSYVFNVNCYPGCGCGIVFDLADSYGDGWHGDNYLVVNYGSTTEQLTLTSGYSESFTRYYSAGTSITLGWISGSYTGECSFTVSYYGGDEIYASSGTLSSSFTYEFDVDCSSIEITQTAELNQDWNWWSTYIEQEGLGGLDLLKSELGTNGQSIKSQSQFTNYNPNTNKWTGSLKSIDNKSTYMIRTANACVVSMTGSVADPSAHPIAVKPGWTWIGYPVDVEMNLADAFASYTPMAGDQVKWQSGFATYNGTKWNGSLKKFTPGKGYMYKSSKTANATLVFPNGGSKGDLEANITAENNHWVPNVHAHPTNMTMMAVVELDEVELAGEHYELAAFANGECRGSVRLMEVEGRHIAFLTIAGEETAELYFGLYDAEKGESILGAEERLQYEANATVGDLDVPFVVHFRGNTGMDEAFSGLHIYPNPVNRGEVVSIAQAGAGTMTVEIVNALGVVVETLYAPTAQTIKAPRVSGVYTLRISVEGKGTCYRKLVVR